MVAGFLRPSGGTAFVNGHDIRTNIEGVRDSLGLCPQHDVLFDTLTVAEHLEFFAKVRCCRPSRRRRRRFVYAITLILH